MVKRLLSLIVIATFFLTSLGPLPKANADNVLGLPIPGTMVNLSPAYQPVIIRGLTIHKDNPFLFDFIVDVGQDNVSGDALKKEGEKLIKYFLASLAIPDKDFWVNLSPYEKDKIIPGALGQTDMGRDLLEQDYVLKQITASLIYPEKQLGKSFWDRVYAKAQAMYGTTQIPVNTFNKVWITADKASVYEHGQTAFVVDQHLKVMLEEDYLSLRRHSEGVRSTTEESNNKTHSIASQIVKQIVLPELEKEINTGKNFANLRQIFNSVILSSWYKNNLKQALLNQIYADQSKVKGINLNDPTIKEQIYEQYLRAYKKGVFNYIKEDINAANGQTTPRKYFSGGIDRGMASHPTMANGNDLAMVMPDWENRLRQMDAGMVTNTVAPYSDVELGLDIDKARRSLFNALGEEIDKEIDKEVAKGIGIGFQSKISIQVTRNIFVAVRNLMHVNNPYAPPSISPSPTEEELSEIKASLITLAGDIENQKVSVTRIGDHFTYVPKKSPSEIRQKLFWMTYGPTLLTNASKFDAAMTAQEKTDDIIGSLLYDLRWERYNYTENLIVVKNNSIQKVPPKRFIVYGLPTQKTGEFLFLDQQSNTFGDFYGQVTKDGFFVNRIAQGPYELSQFTKAWVSSSGIYLADGMGKLVTLDGSQSGGLKVIWKTATGQNLPSDIISLWDDRTDGAMIGELAAGVGTSFIWIFIPYLIDIYKNMTQPNKNIEKADKASTDSAMLVQIPVKRFTSLPESIIEGSLIHIDFTVKEKNRLHINNGNYGIINATLIGFDREQNGIYYTTKDDRTGSPIFLSLSKIKAIDVLTPYNGEMGALTRKLMGNIKGNDISDKLGSAINDRLKIFQLTNKDEIGKGWLYYTDAKGNTWGFKGDAITFPLMFQALTKKDRNSFFHKFYPGTEPDAAMGTNRVAVRQNPGHPRRISSNRGNERESRPTIPQYKKTPQAKWRAPSLKGTNGPGGIDLNTSNGMQWKVSKDGHGVEMNIDPAMIARIKEHGIDSLTPVIFRITPVANIWSLAGLIAPVKYSQLAKI